MRHARTHKINLTGSIARSLNRDVVPRIDVLNLLGIIINVGVVVDPVRGIAESSLIHNIDLRISCLHHETYKHVKCLWTQNFKKSKC